MICVVGTLKSKEGQGAEFEAVFRELAAKVIANEPGASVYQLMKSRTEPDTYKVVEIYKDDEAIKAHGKSDHFRELGRKLGEFLDGRPELEFFDGV